MNTTLEYTLFAILFLTNGYILYKLEIVKAILAALTGLSGRLVNISENNTEEINRLKNTICKKDH